jgi:hypothetical protein
VSALPAGALDALLSGGTEAFDKVIADDRESTRAAMNAQPATTTKTTTPPKSETPAPEKPSAEKPKQQVVPAPALDLADSTVEELRALAGVSVQQIVPPSLRENVDTGMESEWLEWAIRENLPTTTAQRVAEFYVDAATRGPNLDEAVKEFHQTFDRTLSKAQRDLLVRFVREDLLGEDSPGKGETK